MAGQAHVDMHGIYLELVALETFHGAQGRIKRKARRTREIQKNKGTPLLFCDALALLAFLTALSWAPLERNQGICYQESAVSYHTNQDRYAFWLGSS